MLNMFILISLLLVYHAIISPCLHHIIHALHLLCIPIIYYAHVHAYRIARGSNTVGVKFVNPGSLIDQLPNKSLAQQTTLRATRNSWAGQNTWTIGQKNDPISDRKAWSRRNGARFRLRPTSPTRALASVSSPPPDGLSDRKAWLNTTSDSDPLL